ncbi:hypothetical protein B6U91_02180 [Candidatus Pacearchaeota archaeon ex4484_71]|nr:MAG: hypothetical protein B6U91_02180 [Candidatus Pacearchaeota archaeon ex4484_71]
MPHKPSVEEVLRKYSAKIQSQIQTDGSSEGERYSQSYVHFRKELSYELKGYEKWANAFGNFIKITPSEKDRKKLEGAISSAHLAIEPWQAVSFSVTAFFLVFFLGLMISVGIALAKGGFQNFPVLLFILIVVLSIFLFTFLAGYPERLAKKWRLKASSQMVPAILYIVVYMRHTPNLEKAIAFASEHLDYPLALDFKKIFYDVEVGRFSTIKESLDNYLETWRGHSTEFIEAFHLIESSLFEPDNSRRISTLEKSLRVILDGVYDNMLKFTHSVRAPLTNVYMLGVVLPTLGLALLPLASAMVGGFFSYVHVFIIFNLIVPFSVFYLTDKILMLRPGGHGETNLLERNPLYKDYKKSSHYINAFIIALPFLVIGLLPLIFQYTNFPALIGLQKDYTFSQLGIGFMGDSSFFGFIDTGTGVKGPFGLGALILGMFFPLGIAIFFSSAYQSKTKELIKERNKTKDLEKQFNNSLFQLGNRIGNGVPPELAFGKVAESTRNLITGDFFRKVNHNVRSLGMSVEKAIFDKKVGAINKYPSNLIATSMRILIESSKKGLKIAAISLMSISEYVKNINKITVRLKDMLAEIASDMKSNMTFLAPLLSGIVVGLAAMITSILLKLDLAKLGGDSLGSLGGLSGMLDIFNVASMIPPYFLQISVGVYLIQIIFILTGTLVTIDSGEDKLEEIHKTGLNLKKGIMLYSIVAFLSIVSLSILTAVVLGNLL